MQAEATENGSAMPQILPRLLREVYNREMFYLLYRLVGLCGFELSYLLRPLSSCQTAPGEAPNSDIGTGPQVWLARTLG